MPFRSAQSLGQERRPRRPPSSQLAGERDNSTQRLDACAEVDVVGRTAKHQRGHGFDAGLFGLRQARLVMTQVNDFDVEPRRVERGSNILFGSHTNRAARVIEYSFGFHVRFLFRFDGLDSAAHGAVAGRRMVNVVASEQVRKRAQSGGGLPICARLQRMGRSAILST